MYCLTSRPVAYYYRIYISCCRVKAGCQPNPVFAQWTGVRRIVLFWKNGFIKSGNIPMKRFSNLRPFA